MDINQVKISRADIEAGLPLKTWWAMLLVLPVSVRVIQFVVNRTNLSPNLITLLGLVLRLVTAALFLSAGRIELVTGALCYVAAYVCDCTDGAVARLTGRTSEFGRYLDHISDLLGDILILLALAWSQCLISASWIWAMVFMHIAESYVSYLCGFVLKSRDGELSHFILFRWFNCYRSWFFKRNLKSFFSFPDYTALVFVVFPLLGLPLLGLQVGFYFLLIIVLYTVKSTFVSIHTDVKLFP